MILGSPKSGLPGRLSGFTLFEMLVVMVVVALSSAMVVPKLAEAIPKYQLKSSAQTLAASLRFAQNRAVSEMRPVAVILDGENGLITIKPMARPESPMQTLLASTQSGQNDSAQQYETPAGIGLEVYTSEERYESGVFQMVFYPGGNSSGGAVRLQNDRGRRITVVVEQFSGRVKIDPENAPRE